MLTVYLEGEYEFILDASEAVTGEGEFVSPQDPDEDESMAIDEEGRPRFAPVRDIVRCHMKDPMEMCS